MSKSRARGAMLEAIVEQMELGPNLFSAKRPASIAIFADDDRDCRVGAPSAGARRRIRAEDPAGLTSATPRVLRPYPRERMSKEMFLAFSKLTQQEDEGSLAGASDGKIADTDHRASAGVEWAEAAVIELVARAYAQAVGGCEEVHARVKSTVLAADIRFWRAFKVLVVAPCCDWTVSWARSPKRFAFLLVEINSRNTNGSSAGPTMRTASWLWNRLMISRKFSVWFPTTMATPCWAGSRML